MTICEFSGLYVMFSQFNLPLSPPVPSVHISPYLLSPPVPSQCVQADGVHSM